MDIKPADQNPATDDQELAKVLAGMHDEVSQLPAPNANDKTTTTAPSGLQFEETEAPQGVDTTVPPAPTDDANAPTVDTPAVPETGVPMPPAFGATADPEPEVSTHAPDMPALTMPTPLTANPDPELEGIKKDALEELRPLVTKLDLPPEEKFDTMLLIIRSTDDKSLLKPAHEAAKAIEDEQKRAEALLDIVKEIDYFATQHHAA